MSFSFTFLDDIAVADLAFEATGDTVQEMFQGATGALMESMANPSTIGSVWRQEIVRSDGDPALLLFDWLCDLVYYKDAEGVVYSRADLRVDREGDGVWHLKAVLFGEPVDPAKQELRADVKGVTKHLYAVQHQGSRWTARVVLDV